MFYRSQNLKLFVFLIASFIFTVSIFANDLVLGVATIVKVRGQTVNDGSIVSNASQGLALSAKPYDAAMAGVIATNSAITISPNLSGEDSGKNSGEYPMLTSGIARVLVSTVNGPIKVGDLITSSAIPGVGMKATKSGFILGTAQENYSSTDFKSLKPINVVLGMRHSSPRASLQRNLFDVANLSALAWTEEPLTVFRYLMAALILIVSLILGFYIFGRTANRGIEAIGRNPLAAKVIQFGIGLNVLLTVAVIGAGILIAILILTI